MHCVEGEKLKILDAYTMFPCGKKPDYFEKTVRIWLRIETLDLLLAKNCEETHYMSCTFDITYTRGTTTNHNKVLFFAKQLARERFAKKLDQE